MKPCEYWVEGRPPPQPGRPECRLLGQFFSSAQQNSLRSAVAGGTSQVGGGLSPHPPIRRSGSAENPSMDPHSFSRPLLRCRVQFFFCGLMATGTGIDIGPSKKDTSVHSCVDPREKLPVPVAWRPAPGGERGPGPAPRRRLDAAVRRPGGLAPARRPPPAAEGGPARLPAAHGAQPAAHRRPEGVPAQEGWAWWPVTTPPIYEVAI